jgi:enolase
VPIREAPGALRCARKQPQPLVFRNEHTARGIREDVANAVLIELNQIGTLTETRTALQMAFDTK